jgi:hypothetical protein
MTPGLCDIQNTWLNYGDTQTIQTIQLEISYSFLVEVLFPDFRKKNKTLRNFGHFNLAALLAAKSVSTLVSTPEPTSVFTED